jgi:hypothetical protein
MWHSFYVCDVKITKLEKQGHKFIRPHFLLHPSLAAVFSSEATEAHMQEIPI